MPKNPIQLILASSSPARKKQLSQLGLQFQAISPDIDETPLASEGSDQMVLRLSTAKALKIAKNYPDHWVIGCDQVAEFNHIIYGKPYEHSRALKALNIFSGNTVTSKTGICLVNLSRNITLTAIEPYSVKFRKYTSEQADNYLKLEKPYFSAGSINIDGLGVSLIESYQGRDYNSLIGLPLIRLIDLFYQVGIDILQARGPMAPE